MRSESGTRRYELSVSAERRVMESKVMRRCYRCGSWIS